MGALRTTILGIFLTASTAAMADTTTLVCSTPGGSWTRDVVIDEANSFITMGNSGERTPAKFTQNEISFTNVSTPRESQEIVINRLTGAAIEHDFSNGSLAQTLTWTCQVGQKRF